MEMNVLLILVYGFVIQNLQTLYGIVLALIHKLGHDEHGLL